MAIRYTTVLALLLVLSAQQARAQEVPVDIDDALQSLQDLRQRFLPMSVQYLQRVQAGSVPRGVQSRIAVRTEYEPVGEEDWEPELEARFSYEAGHLAAETHFQWSGAEWIPDYRELYIRSNGRLDEVLADFTPDGGDTWLPSERTLLSYENGAMSRLEFQLWDGVEWQPASRYLLAQVGSDVIMTEQFYVSGDWTNEARTTYLNVTLPELILPDDVEDQTNSLFLSILRLSDLVIETWIDGAWYLVERGTWALDDQGRKAFIYVEAYEDGEWWLDARLAYEYDGSQLQAAEYQFPDEDELQTELRGTGNWFTFIREEYEYSADLLSSLTTGLSFGDIVFPLWLFTFSWTEVPVSVEETGRVLALQLGAPYPNPSTGSINLSYRVAEAGNVTVAIYDSRGREVGVVAAGLHAAGTHEVVLDTSGLASGLYIVRLQGEKSSVSRRISIVR